MAGADQDINTVNMQPDQTAPSATAGLRVYEDRYNSGRDYDSEVGKRNLGLADPQNVNAELVPTLETVGGGAQNMSIEELVTGWNGTANVTTQDTNTGMTSIGIGTTASSTVDTYPTVPVEGNVASTGSTLNSIKMDTGDAAAFASHLGKPIEIPTAAGSKLRGYIGDVNTVTDTITLFYPIDELPLAGGAVKLLEGFTIEVGGGQLGMRELLFAQDFSTGASHRTILHKVQSVGGWKPMMNQGAKVTQQASFKIQGVSRLVQGRAQLIPVTIKGKYGRAPLAV